MRLTLLFLALTLVACNQSRDVTRSPGRSAADEAFAGVQARGAAAMGVNQYTSRHVFESLPDGGRIQLEREVQDSAGADQISRHMRHIAERFASGDFALPGFVHARAVPGTAVMTARRAAIAYSVEILPRGAALRLRATDPTALAAIHEFLAFQRQDHHAGGHRDS
jgi:hypothetical protein